MNCNCKSPCGSCRCGMAEGERSKLDALALLEARREVYVRRGRRALLTAALRSGTATADDVRDAVELPPDLDPRCLGPVPGRLAYDGVICAAGFTRSARPERHAGWSQVWELADRAAAERWLRDHPDLPDPVDDQATDRQGTLFDFQETASPTGTAAGAAS